MPKSETENLNTGEPVLPGEDGLADSLNLFLQVSEEDFSGVFQSGSRC